MKYELTVIVPGIRDENWERLFNEATLASKRYTLEFIFVGPRPPNPTLMAKHNVKYIKDFGTPTRSLHIGTLIAEGQYFTWLADDAWVYEESLDSAMDLLMHRDPKKDMIGIRYSEGTNHSGACPPDVYWTSNHHPNFHLPGIDRDYAICGVLLMDLDFYNYMGGLDCAYEHVNMNVHDFAIRAQRNGSHLYMSPHLVMNCDFEPNRTPQNSPVIAAYVENDDPLFRKHYAVMGERPLRIDINNWKQTEPVWRRRFS